MAKILDGKTIAKQIREDLKNKVEGLRSKDCVPGLAVVIVGEDPASRVYVNAKKKACEEIGIRSFEYALDKKTTENDLLEIVNKLNRDIDVSGILVQLPLPEGIDSEKIIRAIDPKKDVDCFHPQNVGNLMMGKPSFAPCTPGGIIELIESCDIDIQGKECVIVGRSNIVGKPVSMLFLSKNGTVTICHSRTKDLKEVCSRADILVAAIGKPEFITKEYLKKGSVVIDVGINRMEDRKLVGDVNFEDANEVCSFVTPVPGGIGPMTIAILMKNTVKAAMDLKGV